MLTALKVKLSHATNGIARLAHKAGFTPNSITILGFLFAILSAISYGAGFSIILAASLWLLSGFLDALDGAVATLFNETTTFGGFLDSVLDRYSDGIVILGIIAGKLCDLTWGLVALVGTLMVSYTRARGEAAGISMASVGLAERGERILIISVASFIAYFDRDVLAYGVVLLAILTHITIIQRTYHVWKVASARKAS